MPAEGPLRNGKPAGFELIETLRWEPAAGFVRLDRHLARLYASAHALGFIADPERIGEALRQCQGDRVSLRVRLTLAKDGEARGVALPFEPLPPETVWTLRIAETRLDPADDLLRHKTTRRDAYDRARAEFPRDEADEVILLNQRGELCEGAITSLFVDKGDGNLLTPSLACGLLAGVLRNELIDTGKATVAVLSEADLRSAKRILVGNSLRGMIRATLAD